MSPLLEDPTCRYALRIVDHVDAMLAYWDETETCQFANRAYLDWFGRSREQLIGTTLRELLGPLYALNEPYIRAAYGGAVQVFERRIPLPDGTVRDSLATYRPHVEDGIVRGIFVQVADATPLKRRERELEAMIAERDRVRAEVRTLEGLLNICSGCKRIHTSDGEWEVIERYVSRHSTAEFSHGICPSCVERLYPEYALEDPPST